MNHPITTGIQTYDIIVGYPEHFHLGFIEGVTPRGKNLVALVQERFAEADALGGWKCAIPQDQLADFLSQVGGGLQILQLV